MKLWLPSALESSVSCALNLQECEWILREAQCRDALHSLRTHLRVDDFLRKRKQVHSRGVSQNTRSQSVINHNSKKLRACKERYIRAWSALELLSSLLKKKTTFVELKDEDIRPLTADKGVGEGSRRLSWIWYSEGVAEVGQDDPSSPQLQDGNWYPNSRTNQRLRFIVALRIQWC
jgi:hypothetical protein